MQLPDQTGPAVEDRQDRVGLLGRQLHDATRDALLLVTPQPVVIRGDPPYRDRDTGEVAPGFGCHLAEMRQEIGDVLVLRPPRMRDPAVAVAQRAPCGMREHATDDYRRVWKLHRLGPGHHRREIDHLSVIFRLWLGPD